MPIYISLLVDDDWKAHDISICALEKERRVYVYRRSDYTEAQLTPCPACCIPMAHSPIDNKAECKACERLFYMNDDAQWVDARTNIRLGDE